MRTWQYILLKQSQEVVMEINLIDENLLEKRNVNVLWIDIENLITAHKNYSRVKGTTIFLKKWAEFQ